MSRLLLARAARLAGWCEPQWRDGWPDLLVAREIAALEADGDATKKADIAALFRACPPVADGRMPAPVPMVPTRNGEEPQRYYDAAYSAKTYAAWPARDWPPSPLITAWLASAGVSTAKPDPVPKTPKAAPRKATESRDEALRAAVDAIESRALEIGYPFDRAQWPGTKAEFRAFLSWHNARLSYQLPADDSRLSDELRPLRVTFANPGRARDKGRKFFKALFPDYPA